MQRNSRKCLKYIIITISLVIIMTISGCGLPGGGKKKDIPKIDMVVENPSDVKRTDEFIVLKVSDLKEMVQDFSQNTFIVLQPDTNKEIPCQLDDMNNDGVGDEIAMVLDMEPKEKKNIMIRYSPESPESRAVTLGHKKRTRSAIHPEYEGIGWESELIGYRLYPDQRNSISIFGKNKAELSLDSFAKNMGLSNAKIILDGGDSVGCGGFGLWYENKLIKPDKDTPRYTRVVSDGPVRSVIQVIYDSWIVGDKSLRVTATYSIFAGQRWSTGNVKIERAGEPMKIASGLTKSKSATLTRNEKNGLFYTYGNQSKMNDALGMALMYPPESLDSFQESDDSYLAILNPGADNDITYWFLSVWSRGEIGVKSASDFAEMVSSTADNLRNPITVTIMPIKKEPQQSPNK
jgi:hypothetical protein